MFRDRREREAPPRLGGGFQVCKLERKLLYSLVALIIDIYLANIPYLLVTERISRRVTFINNDRFLIGTRYRYQIGTRQVPDRYRNQFLNIKSLRGTTFTSSSMPKPTGHHVMGSLKV